MTPNNTFASNAMNANTDPPSGRENDSASGNAQRDAWTVSLFMLYRQGRRVRDLDVSNTNLAHATLDRLRGDAVRFIGTDLTGASLRQVRMTACDFREARLAGVDLADATFRLCTFDGARAAGAQCPGTRIEDSSLQGVDFSKADLRRAHLSESRWIRASLQDAVLDGAEGQGVTMRGADLRGASLADARLVEADFRGADLTGATLAGGDFRDADFRGAILDDVVWGDAERTGARFDARSPGEEAALFFAEVEATAKAADDAPSDAAGATSADIDALETLLAELRAQAVATSAKGKLNLNKEIEAMAGQWEALRAQAGEAGPDDVAALLASLEGAFGASGVMPPEAMASVTRMLQSLDEADDDEPPEAWKAWLEKLFPEITDDEDALDTIAARLASMLGRGARKS